MKKFFFFLSLAVLASSCSLGRYMPGSVNNFGIQTQVVLDRANFHVVRDVEVVEEINNSRLRRVDVERSAYGKLLRQYPLTGSQAFVNVAVEEIDRESTSLFRIIFGCYPALKQYVAIRATIIEFVNENNQPNASLSTSYRALPEQDTEQISSGQAQSFHTDAENNANNKYKYEDEVYINAKAKTEHASSTTVETVLALTLEEDNSPLISEEKKQYAENLISQSIQLFEKKNASKDLIETYQEIVNSYREKPTENALDNINALYQYIIDRKYVKVTKAIKNETDKNRRVSILLNAAYEALKE